MLLTLLPAPPWHTGVKPLCSTSAAAAVRRASALCRRHSMGGSMRAARRWRLLEVAS